ncbi:hypothetical protein, partial [Mycolicibacterium vanbaalenii]|uniref:hypothetical protein n=1 Tax=Mycolicibacterium vanbaalenii TaxID=110539 RepID=UPI0021F2B79F
MKAVPNPLRTRSAIAANPAGTSYWVRGQRPRRERPFHQAAQAELRREPDDVLEGDIGEIKGPSIGERMVTTAHEDH